MALAWGYEGHEVIADIARHFLTPDVAARVDQMLAQDPDTLTGHDMASEATWADVWRGAGHRETASWHFVDIELTNPDLKGACFGFPPSGPQASQGPAQDCVVDKINAFSAELSNPATPPAERLLALKYLLHFVGDVHQPLHASDNQDRGGNCVQVSLGGSRTTNLHAYWDTAVVNMWGANPAAVAATLTAQITPTEETTWRKGDASAWALESYSVSKGHVYTLGSKPRCDANQSPITLPDGYAGQAKAVAGDQMKKAGVRLARVLNRALSAN